jgi:adenylate cyclase
MTDSKSPSELEAESAAARTLTWTFERPGRFFALCILLALVALRYWDPRIISTLRLRGFDMEQEITPRVYRPLPVRIVAIDDKSLKRFGQWPWPRAELALLVDRIAQGKPSALGVDIIFAEPDRFSPPQLALLPGIPKPLAGELALLPPSGALLADAFRKLPTVLGVGFSYEAPSGPQEPMRVPIVRQIGLDPRPYLLSYAGLIRSLHELTVAAKAQAALEGQADPDGIVRRVPLFVLGHGNIIPSLALETLQVASGDPMGISTGTQGVRGATLDDMFMPTDWRARAYPYYTPFEMARYVSAADLMEGSYDPANLHHELVLLGVTGLGLVDQKQTPLGQMPGVEVTAQIIESMLLNSLLSRPGVLDKVEMATLAVIGLITIFVLPYQRRLRTAGLILVAMVVALLAFQYASFRLAHLLFDAIYAALSVSIVFAVMLGTNLRDSVEARRRLAEALVHERESKARLEGELNAARAIQMGLLPHGSPSRPGVDVYAVIEPAREVGGDLYDFVMIDSRRISFAIADVSGKGIPAALFMAMSKEVLRAATMSHGEALDKAFAEANARISAASNDMAGVGANMMFVTVFAGVLDLTNGKLVYINAGHDAPFLLRDGCAPTRLTGTGGPPLGSVDDFFYGVEQCQLAAGELVLMFTDGVTEAEDAQNAFYGEARLDRLLTGMPVTGAEAIVNSVREDVRSFVGGAEQADDLTMLAVRWLGARTNA